MKFGLKLHIFGRHWWETQQVCKHKNSQTLAWRFGSPLACNNIQVLNAHAIHRQTDRLQGGRRGNCPQFAAAQIFAFFVHGRDERGREREQQFIDSVAGYCRSDAIWSEKPTAAEGAIRQHCRRWSETVQKKARRSLACPPLIRGSKGGSVTTNEANHVRTLEQLDQRG